MLIKNNWQGLCHLPNLSLLQSGVGKFKSEGIEIARGMAQPRQWGDKFRLVCFKNTPGFQKLQTHREVSKRSDGR